MVDVQAQTQAGTVWAHRARRASRWIPALRAHPHIGRLLVRSETYGAIGLSDGPIIGAASVHAIAGPRMASARPARALVPAPRRYGWVAVTRR